MIPGFQWVCIIVAFVFAWLWSRQADQSRKHCDWYYVGIVGVLVTGFTARMMLEEQTSERLIVLLLVACLAIQFIDQWLIENRARQSAQWKLAGRCETCGYDVRAAAGRCPECGTPVPVTQPSDSP